jgi:hypothetical protein
VKPLRLGRRHKYNAREAVTRSGRYASQLEARVGQDCELMAKALGAKLERQVRFPLVVNGVPIATYVADFTLTWPATGLVEVVEAKGVQTREWLMKAKLMAALYPNHKIRVASKDGSSIYDWKAKGK